MKTNDQWFEPGTKVMRVAYADDLWRGVSGIEILSIDPRTEKGNVLCVLRCEADEKFGNDVWFVGIPDEYPYLAACFRRVSEIQLCVSAVRKSKTREGVEV